MTATIGAATAGPRPELLCVTYRRFRRMGFEDPVAANLTAVKNGFRITVQPWTIRELTHLLFVRESHRVGRRRLDMDDRDPANGRLRPLNVFRSMAGPDATLTVLRPSAPPRLDAADGADREGG
jgi:hypothetical protein